MNQTSSPKNFLEKVKQQYEELPYPPCNPEDEKTFMKVPYTNRLPLVNHACYAGKQNFENNYRVLVAGGGTGDAAIFWAEQLRELGGTVVYVDLSQASQAIAKERARLRGLDNIEWHHASLLDLPQMTIEPFDFINCCGVLHHLEDPNAGLKALKAVLKEDGVMDLMVYGQYGRTGVYMMQDMLRRILGREDDTSKQIAATRQILSSLAQPHWWHLGVQLASLQGELEPDTGLYDLLLHSQDRAYTMPEVYDWVESCDLRLLDVPRYENRQDLYRPELRIKDKALRQHVLSLPLKEQQAIGELMSGCIAKHEFYVTHTQAPNQPVDRKNYDLIPYFHGVFTTNKELAELARQCLAQKQNVGVFKCGRYQTSMIVSELTPLILDLLGGKTSARDIMKKIRKTHKKWSVNEIFAEYDNIVDRFHAVTWLVLRDKDVPIPTEPVQYINRVREMYGHEKLPSKANN